MARHTLAILLVVVLFTMTQGFSWGRVFINEKNANHSNEGDGINPSLPEIRSAMMREETEVAERPLPDSFHEEREKSVRGARSEEEKEQERSEGRFGEKKSVLSEEKISRREVEPVSAGATSTEDKKEIDSELHSLQKEVADIKQPLGPDIPPERVEVVGVPREHEHHITDGLADAIAGLMRVYNSLVRSDGRDWERSTHGSVYPEKVVERDGMNSTSTEEKTDDASVRVSDTEVEKKGGWGPLGALAGIVVVAGVGVALVGFRRRERESPVYPPRGPAYV